LLGDRHKRDAVAVEDLDELGKIGDLAFPHHCKSFLGFLHPSIDHKLYLQYPA
jgi:hypothetical protein